MLSHRQFMRKKMLFQILKHIVLNSCHVLVYCIHLFFMDSPKVDFILVIPGWETNLKEPLH